ncbi:GNAT family N-acetyltransferase [Undibacterium pigrum]|uniref:CelD/BcsL family acetyltransferase involved in cellulose biosynthesis n=1 Tax=Undibacterium pigrum TaxID=401470 RepID=A0A318JJ53_9BURK|nr:GNAT family N-acetyltransferase [Undibacterium pigrum]PXX47459.1 CelD/BcsL family acetyltransferase involved in cellulose biosynthesis [Undibacterium pigrum]
MKFRLIRAKELDASIMAHWADLRGQNVVYDSPYYAPAFTSIIASAREDARILLCEDAGSVAGIWPFHALSNSRAVSIGDFLADYQGPICKASIDLDFGNALRAMQCRYFSYNHMPLDLAKFSEYAWVQSQSHTLDLTGGFEAYAQRLTEKRDATLLKKVATNERKLSKKYGDLRFELQSTSDADFAALLAGKSDQYQRTVGAEHDIFKRDWVRKVVDEIRITDTPDFAGMVSTLYAGDTLIAAHFGMRSSKVMHYWFPWYHTDYAEYSPGLVLLAQCARHAAQAGISLIDLGRGDQAYKLRFATGAQQLCEGAISSPAILSLVQAGLYHGKQMLKASSLGQHLRKLRQATK